MQIIKHKHIFLGIAAVIVVASLAIVATLGIKLGIDFTGGALTEVAYGGEVSTVSVDIATTSAEIASTTASTTATTTPTTAGTTLTPAEAEAVINDALAPLALGTYSLRATDGQDARDAFLLRTRDLSEEERILLEETLSTVLPQGEVVRFTSVGPTIGQELKTKAVWAIGLVSLMTILYVAFAFRGIGYPVGSWVYGVITIITLLHDVLVPTAVMALLGYFAGVEADVLFVMALLAVLGYSVNDTIVVFDRVRENLVRYRQEKKKVTKDEFGQELEEIEYIPTKPFADVVQQSVSETFTRSINTSVTTALALTALYLFGADVTATFAATLLIGVVAGAYSSIFISNPLLVWYAERFAADKVIVPTSSK